MRDIPNSNEIIQYMHCSLCLQEKPDDVSPQDWARTQTGFTTLGIQVWCVTHNVNICHIDFEGHQHPANVTRKRDN